MTYFADLSRYTYGPGWRRMLNVGWLERGHDFAVGQVESGVLDRLTILAEHQENVMRGTHDCQFCTLESPLHFPAPVARGFVSLGMGELHVKGRWGVKYAAPSLIIHYISAHSYLPPQEFLDAVRVD
ncbi:hypothetical protein E1263_19455 [Kribbella antibiotica]|uniref:DUF7919 domain-containing protein n=1 Tax=Kribbella antibiotica TaxID=190195 RepID=A0A4R4ZK24_9ACTN|nr:hypothetical protein [Kribbella antibiotica]TDD58396.1 hypothetical protein E1263_19455 [Kribbella antibiotica]